MVVGVSRTVGEGAGVPVRVWVALAVGDAVLVGVPVRVDAPGAAAGEAE